ncbi:DUF262 domain-containing protein [Capnocytophaga granulosa]
MSNKTTFLSFAQNKKIEIPIFQRDYAQGRNDKTTDKIRKDFVSSLIEALDKNTPIELDFIYGREVDNTITLIDGQQRLTTLFLLHWYISQRIGKIDAFKNIKFSYATRDYAKDFTAKLTTEEDFKIDFTQAISTELKDKNWFYDDWQHDPTVSGMLNTLDEIHKQLRDKTIEHYWSLLEQGIITFYWLDLEEHQLTDELYLKMNARGKQLSKFENFKASLIKHMADEQWEGREDFSEKKMDTTYTDLFWQYRGDQTVIDNEAMNFFAGIAMIAHALRDKSDHERIEELYYDPLLVTASDFSVGDFKLITEFLDLYSKPEDFYIDTPLWDKDFKADSGKTFFEIFIKDNKSFYKQRVFFYALTQLFIKVEDKAIRENFIRVVRNIVENATIDSAQTFVGAIKLMKELLEGFLEVLSKGVQDIYSYLSKTAIQSKFASYQVAKEIDKAKRIVADSQWKEAIWEAEDHPMFKGDIGFLLLETENNLDLFKKRYEVAKEMFDEDGVTDKYKENMLLIRALISRFDQWDLVTHGLTFDCEKETWKKILKYDNYWVRYFLNVLDSTTPLASTTPLRELIKQPSRIIDRERPHQELYQTQLLEAIEERRRNYDYWKRKISYHGRHKYILYYDKSKTEGFRYIFADDRNEKLAKAVEKGIITTEQQLEVNGEKIPFFWGWDIKFTYKEEVYIWRYQYFDDIVKEANKEICTEEAMQKIFSSSL